MSFINLKVNPFRNRVWFARVRSCNCTSITNRKQLRVKISTVVN